MSKYGNKKSREKKKKTALEKKLRKNIKRTIISFFENRVTKLEYLETICKKCYSITSYPDELFRIVERFNNSPLYVCKEYEECGACGMEFNAVEPSKTSTFLFQVLIPFM